MLEIWFVIEVIFLLKNSDNCTLKTYKTQYSLININNLEAKKMTPNPNRFCSNIQKNMHQNRLLRMTSK